MSASNEDNEAQVEQVVNPTITSTDSTETPKAADPLSAYDKVKAHPTLNPDAVASLVAEAKAQEETKQEPKEEEPKLPSTSPTTPAASEAATTSPASSTTESTTTSTDTPSSSTSNTSEPKSDSAATSTATEPAKLFVGQVPNSTDDVNLRNIFSQYGTVLDVLILTDRNTGQRKGCGFVTMSSKVEVTLNHP